MKTVGVLFYGSPQPQWHDPLFAALSVNYAVRTAYARGDLKKLADYANALVNGETTGEEEVDQVRTAALQQPGSSGGSPLVTPNPEQLLIRPDLIIAADTSSGQAAIGAVRKFPREERTPVLVVMSGKLNTQALHQAGDEFVSAGHHHSGDDHDVVGHQAPSPTGVDFLDDFRRQNGLEPFQRIAVLSDGRSEGPQSRAKEVADRAGGRAIPAQVEGEDFVLGFKTAFDTIVRKDAEAMVMVENPLMVANRQLILEFVYRNGIAATFGSREFVSGNFWIGNTFMADPGAPLRESRRGFEPPAVGEPIDGLLAYGVETGLEYMNVLPVAYAILTAPDGYRGRPLPSIPDADVRHELIVNQAAADRLKLPIPESLNGVSVTGVVS